MQIEIREIFKYIHDINLVDHSVILLRTCMISHMQLQLGRRGVGGGTLGVCGLGIDFAFRAVVLMRRPLKYSAHSQSDRTVPHLVCLEVSMHQSL